MATSRFGGVVLEEAPAARKSRFGGIVLDDAPKLGSLAGNINVPSPINSLSDRADAGGMSELASAVRGLESIAGPDAEPSQFGSLAGNVNIPRPISETTQRDYDQEMEGSGWFGRTAHQTVAGIWNEAKALGADIATGMAENAPTTTQDFAGQQRVQQSQEMLDDVASRATRDQLELEAAVARKNTYGQGLATNAISNIAKVAAAAPTGLLGTAGVMAHEQARRSYEATGDKKYAATMGALEGGVQTAFNAVGLGGLEQGLLKSGAWRGLREFAKQATAELAEEEITAFGQDFAARVLDHPDQTTSPGKLAVNTAVQTFVTMGLAKGVNAGVTKFSDAVSNPSRRTFKEAGLDGVATTQKQRRDVANGAKDVLTVEQFRSQLDSLAKEGGPITPEQSRYLYYLTEARAKAIGESTADYIGKRLKGVEKAKLADTLAQRGQSPETLGQPAYHGTPHKFDKFTTDKIGTGEGNQSYGWGLYFAGNREVAKYYRDTLARRHANGPAPQDRATLEKYFTPGRIVKSYGGHDRVLGFEWNDGQWRVKVQEVVLKEHPGAPAEWVDAPGAKPRNHATYPALRDLVDADVVEKPGALYKVDVKPTDDELLDWDKPLSEQPEKVQRALGYSPETGEKVNVLYSELKSLEKKMSQYASLPDGQFVRGEWDKLADRKTALREALESLGARTRGSSRGTEVDYETPTGRDAYRRLEREAADGDVAGSTAQLASKKLHSLGIRGIKYLDGSSRSKGEGHHNYVIFDDADVAIEEVLAQKSKGRIRRGEIEFLKDDGRAVIRAFESANFSTVLHELGHLFRRDLAGSDLAQAERWAGVKDGKWHVAAEEKFARGFEKYMHDGTAPSPALKRLYGKLSEWMRNVYQTVKGTKLDVNIPEDMRGVYDRLFGAGETATSSGAQTGHFRPTNEENTGNYSDVNVAPKPAQPEPAISQNAQPADVLSQDLGDRFRGLANQTAIPEARQANFDVDVEMGYPERRKWADAEAAAQQRLTADPVGELNAFRQKIDAAHQAGGTIDLRDMTDAVVLNKLKEHAAQNLSDPASRQLHRELHQAFREARTEQARSLGYRDPLGTQTPEQRSQKAVTDAIAEPTPAETEARKTAKTPAERAAVDQQMEQRYTKAKDELAKMGIDLDDIASIAADPKKAMLVLDKFRPKLSRSDMLYEYWRNAILSGPRTQATNLIGNTLFAGWHLGPERAVEAAVNLFGKNPDAAQFGEFKHLAAGILPGIKRGLRNAITSWRLETSALADELGREGAFKVEGARGAIPGKTGRLIRALGYRPLLAADEFAKSITATMETGAHAYRAGKKLGLEGNKLQEFVAQQVDDLGSVSWGKGLGKAEEMAFQGQRGIVAQSLSTGGNKLRGIKGVRWVVPFVDTPAAIIEQGLKRAPVLGAILDYAEARRSGAGLVDSGMTPTLARQIIGTAAAALLWSAVDDEDPWITGAAVLSDPNNRDAAYRTMPPMSIKVGDRAYSYQRIEPFGTTLAWTVDFIRGLKQGKPMSATAFSTAQQLKNKSYLDGLGDVMDMIEGLGSGEAAPIEEWTGKFAASWIPNLWRQTVSSIDGTIPENRVWGKEDERALRVIKRTGQAAQVPGLDVHPRYDIWGREIRYNDSWGNAATDFAWSLLSPVKVKDLDTVQRADLALVRWNVRNPNDQRVWSEPQRYVEDQKKTHYLTDQQYAEYAKKSGQLAQKIVSRLGFNPDKPTKTQVDAIGRAITRARKISRGSLLPKWRKEWATP